MADGGSGENSEKEQEEGLPEPPAATPDEVLYYPSDEVSYYPNSEPPPATPEIITEMEKFGAPPSWEEEES